MYRKNIHTKKDSPFAPQSAQFLFSGKLRSREILFFASSEVLPFELIPVAKQTSKQKSRKKRKKKRKNEKKKKTLRTQSQ